MRTASVWIGLLALVLFLLAVVEGWSRLLGGYDFGVKGDRQVVWDMAWSQKENVQDVREGRDEAKKSFAVATRTQAEQK